MFCPAPDLETLSSLFQQNGVLTEYGRCGAGRCGADGCHILYDLSLLLYPSPSSPLSYFSLSLSLSHSVCLSVSLNVSIHLSINFSLNLNIYLSPPICLSTCLTFTLSPWEIRRARMLPSVNHTRGRCLCRKAPPPAPGASTLLFTTDGLPTGSVSSTLPQGPELCLSRQRRNSIPRS